MRGCRNVLEGNGGGGAKRGFEEVASGGCRGFEKRLGGANRLEGRWGVGQKRLASVWRRRGRGDQVARSSIRPA